MANLSFCQGWINSSNGIEQNMYLSGVSFSNPSKGWCVSSSGGRIFTTNDGGANWSRNFFSDGIGFIGVQAINDSTVWAVRDLGQAFRTTNGGASWTSSATVGFQVIRDFSFISAGTGWLLGGGTGVGLWRTTDSGNTWVNQSGGWPNIFQLSLNAVCFVDANNGWAVGSNGVVLRTSNGGSTWVQQASNTTTILRDVFFINSTTGWAIGDNGTIIRTSNGGATWTPSTNAGTTNVLFRVHFASSMLGWAVGENGTIIQSTDGGATWVSLISGTTSLLRDIFLISPNRGWAVGHENTVLQFGSATLPTN
ncbi:MAG TPA: hypothetical protein DCQ29_02740, partial [Chitinophagaceae bacterium]|nr:hypothetical protein [Chitinophagaceae bacterium]